MATDIGSLAAGLAGHALGIEIENRGLRKTLGNHRNYFLGAHTFL
jgi:hypothetical protein